MLQLQIQVLRWWFGFAEVLQSDLWLEKWHMAFNASKCFLLRVTRSRDNVVNYTYTIMGQPITSVSQHKYQGVELDFKLTWNEHISAITGKAYSSLGFLRRNLYFCPKQIKMQAYYSLVIPHLKYACSVWNPHTQKNIQSIEKVQRRAARFVKKCNQCTLGTITSLLEELKWPSLEHRRKQTSLTNLCKIVNGTLAVEIPNYFSQKERQTRNDHPLKFINAGCRTNIYKYSFFPRSVKEWNELPETIIEAANTEAFKLALRAQARPHWALQHFWFWYHHVARAQHISAEDGLYCPLQIRQLDLD